MVTSFPTFSRTALAGFPGLDEHMRPIQFMGGGTTYRLPDSRLSWTAYWTVLYEMFGMKKISSIQHVNSTDDVTCLQGFICESATGAKITIGATSLGLTVVAMDEYVQCTLVIRTSEEPGPAMISVTARWPEDAVDGDTKRKQVSDDCPPLEHQTSVMSRICDVTYCLMEHLNALAA